MLITSSRHSVKPPLMPGPHQDHPAALQGADHHAPLGIGHEAGHGRIDAQHVGGVTAEHDQRIQFPDGFRRELRPIAEHERGIGRRGSLSESGRAAGRRCPARCPRWWDGSSSGHPITKLHTRAPRSLRYRLK